jgi:hypothetical protein
LLGGIKKPQSVGAPAAGGRGRWIYPINLKRGAQLKMNSQILTDIQKVPPFGLDLSVVYHSQFRGASRGFSPPMAFARQG